jgi:Holliday junction DNA helicase RuvB
MNIIQLLNGKERGNKGILSYIANFLTIESPNLEQTNKEDKELTDSEKNENTDIFKFIYGHEKLKIIFRNAIESEEPIHILLTGAPSTAKSLFLEAISDNIKQSYLINNNSTGAGIISYLYDHSELKFLLIDEIEKLKKEELAVLLSIMENQRLIITKKTMICNRKQKLAIFATCNNKNKLSQEMLSRFLKFHLKEYSLEEFNMIATNIVTDRFNRTQEFAKKIAAGVWYKMNSKDIRDIIKIARLANKESDIDMIIEAIQEYGENKN